MKKVFKEFTSKYFKGKANEKRSLLGAFLALFMSLMFTNSFIFAATDETHPGFRVEGRFLYDHEGEKQFFMVLIKW